MGWIAGRLWAGLRRRRGALTLVFVLAAIVAMIAATTPVLIMGVEQAALGHALGSSTIVQRSVLSNASSSDQGLDHVTSAQSRERAEAATAALGRSQDWTDGRSYREQNDQPLKWVMPAAVPGQLRQRLADIPSCADVRFVSGRCPRLPEEGALADTTFRQRGLRLGQRVTLASPLRRVTVTIVGVYDPSTTVGALQARPGQLADASYDGLDADLLLSEAGYTALRLPTTTFSLRTLNAHVPLADLPAIRAGIARARAVAFTAAGASASTNVITTLDSLLDRVDEQRTVVTGVLAVVAVGAFGLALLALAAVIQRVARVRASEWALPRLRGLARGRRVGARLVEPSFALLLGALVGTGVAVAASAVLVDPTTRRTFGELAPIAVAFAGAATLCGVLALVLVSSAADRRPLDEQFHRATEPRELSRGALVGEAVVVVAALAAVVALSASPGAAVNGAGLLAPVLVAMAAGFLVLQLTLILVRRRTRTVPTSLVDLVVWRRLSRAPSSMVANVLVAAAVSLGTFAVMTSGTAEALGSATAAAETAAATVLHVRTPAAVSLLTAVQRADPSGTRAMAAEEVLGREGVFRVIAVDSQRLEAVSPWRSAWAGFDPDALRRRLAPPVQPSLHLQGRRVSFEVEDIAPGPVDEGDQEFELQVTVQSPLGLVVVPLGVFEATGSRTFTAAIPCADGCTLVSLSVRCADQYKSPWSLHLLVAAMSTDEEPTSRFAPALQHGRWTSDNGHVLDPTLPILSTVRPGPSGLAVDLNDSVGGDQPAVRVQDTVEPLPVVFGATTTADEFPGASGTTIGTGIDGSAILIRPISRASALPRLLGDGVLVDLRRLLPQVDSSTARPDEQVWVRGDPGPVQQRLRAAGVRILRIETLTAAQHAQAAEAGPLSARFALVGATGALVVVLLALLGARLLAAPVRRRQWRSFAAAGLPAPRMRRLVAVEFVTPAVAAVVLGALCGALTFLLALPHLPLADEAPAAPPVGVTPPWYLAAVFPGVAIVVVLLMAVVVVLTETSEIRSGGA